MAACGTCHREVTWATGPDGEAIAIDTTPSYDGRGRFTLAYDNPGERPRAVPIERPGYFIGYHRHDAVCGRARPT